jgi:hypothetical protein
MPTRSVVATTRARGCPRCAVDRPRLVPATTPWRERDRWRWHPPAAESQTALAEGLIADCAHDRRAINLVRSTLSPSGSPDRARVTDLSVELRTAARAELVVERIAEQDVGEAHPVGGAGHLGDGSLADRLIEQAQYLLGRPSVDMSRRTRRTLRSGSSTLPSLGDMGLEGLGGAVGSLFAPQLVDRSIGRDDLVEIEEQDRQQAALLGSLQRKRFTVAMDLERPEGCRTPPALLSTDRLYSRQQARSQTSRPTSTRCGRWCDGSASSSTGAR